MVITFCMVRAEKVEISNELERRIIPETVESIYEQDFPNLIDRQHWRFMGDGAAYNYLAMREAIEHAGLEANEISHPRVGLVVGTGALSRSDKHCPFRP